MDPNDVTAAGIQTLQDSIKKLNGLIQQPGADIPGINEQIRQLIAEQTDLRAMELKQDLDDVSAQAAVQALTDTAARLTAAAAKIKNVSTACSDAAEVVNTASLLITVLSPFLA